MDYILILTEGLSVIRPFVLNLTMSVLLFEELDVNMFSNLAQNQSWKISGLVGSNELDPYLLPWTPVIRMKTLRISNTKYMKSIIRLWTCVLNYLVDTRY